MPHLQHLVVNNNNFSYINHNFGFDDNISGSQVVRALLQGVPGAVMGRIQTLNINSCGVGICLDQIVTSMPDTASMSLVEIDLSSNLIDNTVGGETLARFLLRCEQLQKLNLSFNALGANGARALALALTHLRYLKELKLYSCQLQEGITPVLTSLTTRPPCLTLLDIGNNALPPTSLVPLVAFLNATGGGYIDWLNVEVNRSIFQGNEYNRPFFDTLANNKTIQCLEVGACRMDEETEGLLLDTLVKNTTLTNVTLTNNYHPIHRLQSKTWELMLRNKLLTKIETTMGVPTDIPKIVWPEALAACTRRANGAGIAPIFCLIQKMNEANNVFQHSAAVYRFEKVLACKWVQQWWRARRPAAAAIAAAVSGSADASALGPYTVKGKSLSAQGSVGDEGKKMNETSSSLSSPLESQQKRPRHH